MVDYQQQHTHWENITGQRLPDHPVSRLFAEQRWNFVERYIELSEIHTMLDVGAGLGVATKVQEPHIPQIASVDFSHQQIAQNPSSPGMKGVADGARLPFASHAFDLVTTWEVLHHVPDPSRVVKEMVRLSRRWVIIFEPNPINPAQFAFSAIVPAERGTLSLTSSLITDALHTSGAHVEFFGRCGLIFPNKSPLWFAQGLAAFPFRIPLIGISRLWVARVRR